MGLRRMGKETIVTQTGFEPAASGLETVERHFAQSSIVPDCVSILFILSRLSRTHACLMLLQTAHSFARSEALQPRSETRFSPALRTGHDIRGRHREAEDWPRRRF
jgi:hypothetical protein